ncbi:MAG: sulfatase [Verrucomicrobiota bacterium]
MTLRLAFCITSLLALFYPVVMGAQETNRLNILFCFADDWGRYASAYAKIESHPSLNQVIRTPHIDRVAREGVLFRNAFVPAPSCTPCRSALLSGRYWWNTGRGAILQGAIWDTNIPTFPLLLRQAGYHIGKSYKVWSPGTPADAPFGGQTFAYEKAGRAPNNFSEEATKLIQQGLSAGEAREKILAQVRENFDAFLADRKPGQPWLYWFGATTTHRTWIKGSGKKLWDIDPETLKNKMPGWLPDAPEVREDVVDYLGECQAFDSYVGVLLKRLEQTGELERTLVVVSGDHGMPGVPGGKCNLYDFGSAVALVARWPGKTGGRMVEDFVKLMDLAPTFLEIGGAPIPPGMSGRSIAAQLKSSASGQIDPSRTFVITGRERHVGAAREGNLPYPMRALRTRDYLYIRNFEPDRWPMGAPYAVTETSAPTPLELETNTRVAFPDFDASPTKAWLVARRNEPEGKRFFERAFGKRPMEELYDLREDPDQLRNVANELRYAAQKKELQLRLMELLAEAKDPRVGAAPVKFDLPPFTDPERPRR